MPAAIGTEEHELTHAADGLYPAFVFVYGAVIETELYFGHLADGLVWRTVLTDEIADLIFSHGKIDIHLSGVRHGGQWLRNTRPHQCSCAIRQRAEHQRNFFQLHIDIQI